MRARFGKWQPTVRNHKTGLLAKKRRDHLAQWFSTGGAWTSGISIIWKWLGMQILVSTPAIKDHSIALWWSRNRFCMTLGGNVETCQWHTR